MRQSIFAAAAIAGVTALGATGASAQSATQAIALSANVVGTCLIGSTTPGTGTASGTADAIVIPNTATAGRVIAGATYTSPTTSNTYNVNCSTPVIVSVTSTNDGLTGPAAGGTTTENFINYTASVGYIVAGTSYLANLTTGGGASPGRTATSPTPPLGAYNGTIGVIFTTVASTSGKTLIPGSYNDTLSFNVIPQ